LPGCIPWSDTLKGSPAALEKHTKMGDPENLKKWHYDMENTASKDYIIFTVH
jgi:hypothetical protein